MNEALETIIEDVQERIKAEEPSAIDAAVKLTEQYPDEPKVWRTLAYAKGRNEDYPAAIAAMTRAIELASPHPAWLFNRGRYALMAGDYDGAIADLTQGLVLCDELNEDPFREVLHFLRAEAFFQLGRKAEARADLEHVEDDCVFWTVEVRSKAELLELCAE